MSVEFFTERGFPRELRTLNGLRHYRRYGDGTSDSLNAVANIVGQASPWNLLTGLFVDKPKAEAAAQVAEAQIQAQAIAAQQAAQMKTLRTVAIAGAGLVGLVLIVTALKPRPPKAVSNYRRKRSRR